MQKEEICQTLTHAIPDAKATAEGEDCNFTLTVVSNSFEGQKTLVRQQAVLAPFNDLLRSGELHALSVKAYTETEWQSLLKQSAPVKIEL